MVDSVSPGCTTYVDVRGESAGLGAGSANAVVAPTGPGSAASAESGAWAARAAPTAPVAWAVSLAVVGGSLAGRDPQAELISQPRTSAEITNGLAWSAAATRAARTDVIHRCDWIRAFGGIRLSLQANVPRTWITACECRDSVTAATAGSTQYRIWSERPRRKNLRSPRPRAGQAGPSRHLAFEFPKRRVGAPYLSHLNLAVDSAGG